MSPVFSQEFAPDTQSQPSVLLPLSSGTPETGKRVRASFTALGLALSLGATGSLVSSAEAADSMQLAALPSVSGDSGTLPSLGSNRPQGASASYHTVIDGETIWDIARQHGLTVHDIKSANGIGEGQVIQAGQVLKVPAIASSASALMDSAELEAVREVDVSSKQEEFQEDTEVTVAALPEAGVPVQSQKIAIADLSLDAPQAAPVPEVQVSAVTTEDIGESDFNVDVDTAVEPELESAPTKMPTSSVDPFSGKTPLAVLPETEPQVESVQEFADQLNAIGETSDKGKSATSQPESTVQAAREERWTHRVGSGETIWSIARNYGLDPDALQQANQIDNPRLITPGDELTIPAGGSVEAAQDPAVERLSYRQLANEQRMAAIAPVIETTSPAAVEEVEEGVTIESAASSEAAPAFEAADSQQTADMAVADPFIQDILSQAAAVHSQTARAATPATQQVASFSEEVAVEASEDDAIAAPVGGNSESTEVAINPQFIDDAEAELTGVEVDTRSEELLAAAPLGSEVYAPVVENPAGRVVSPDMPVLPGQDAYLPEAPNRFEGYMWPAQGVLTSGYGWRWGRMHRGVDIAGPVGTPIYAAAPGVVVTSGWNSGGYGNLVDIRHPDGSMTRYAHNSRLMVSAGQQVRQGQQIAEMGSTGYSTGPHLHFEVHIPNQGTVNPIAMLPGR